MFSSQGQVQSVGPNPQKITSGSSEPFATKLGIVVHYHEPECCVAILDCCPQGGSGWGVGGGGVFLHQATNLVTFSLIVICFTSKEFVSETKCRQ